MHHAPPKTIERRLRSLSTGAVAALAGCDRGTVRRAIENGDLPAVRLGPRGNYRVPAEAVEEWLRPAHDPEETR